MDSINLMLAFLLSRMKNSLVDETVALLHDMSGVQLQPSLLELPLGLGLHNNSWRVDDALAPITPCSQLVENDGPSIYNNGRSLSLSGLHPPGGKSP